MKRKITLNPDTIAVLCADPRQHRQQRTIYQPPLTPNPMPEPKQSFWGKVGGFFKKAKSVVKPVIEATLYVMGAAAAFLSAFARLKSASGKKAAKKSRKAFRPHVVAA